MGVRVTRRAPTVCEADTVTDHGPQKLKRKVYERELARLESEFGLTPAARSGVTAEKREESASTSGDKSRFFR